MREITNFPLQKWFHNHFIINSVSFKDGLKFHDSRAFYKLLKETSDRICEEHGLSVIKEPKGKGISKNLLMMEQAGMPTRYNVAREALDDAIAKSCNLQELKANLRANGFQCQFASNRKYWTITLPGWKKPIRTYKLGEEYSRERIEQRVYSNNIGARILRRRDLSKRGPQYTFKKIGH